MDRFRALLPETADLPVVRHVLPNLRALNFVVEGILGEGVASQARFDPQAKALGEWLRSRYVDIPEAVLTPEAVRVIGSRAGDPGGCVVTVLASAVDPTSPEYAVHRDAMLVRLEGAGRRARQGARAAAARSTSTRHQTRGKLLARERIELLLDPDTPVPGAVAAGGLGQRLPGRRLVVTGIGVVEGVECLITANDPTVRGGASNPWTLKKALRANEIALRQPAAGDHAGRVRRRGSAVAEGDLHPGRGGCSGI